MQMELDIFYKKAALTIKHFRQIEGLTQEQLAEKAGISLDYLGKIEATINKPGLVGLIKIINALEISFKEFFAYFEDI